MANKDIFLKDKEVLKRRKIDNLNLIKVKNNPNSKVGILRELIEQKSFFKKLQEKGDKNIVVLGLWHSLWLMLERLVLYFMRVVIESMMLRLDWICVEIYILKRAKILFL